jgi:hypothetical protein
MWGDQVRRIADSGYSTLLSPNLPDSQLAPGPTLAFAAAQAVLRAALGRTPASYDRPGAPAMRYCRTSKLNLALHHRRRR